MDRITAPQPVVQRQLRISGLLLFNGASQRLLPPHLLGEEKDQFRNF